jgi:hypothetical protein
MPMLTLRAAPPSLQRAPCDHGRAPRTPHRPPRIPHSAPRIRRGIALATVLALLALSAALLAGGFASATASSRAARSARAGIVASAGARRALGRVLLAWSSVEDALPVGAMIERASIEDAALPRDAVDARVRVQRLSPNLFVVASDVTVPAGRAPLARRRMRVLVRRTFPTDSTVVRPPRAIARWSLGELF